MTRVRKPRHGRRGLTLVEVVIGTLIAIFLTSAAVVFATHETKLLGFSTEQIEMHQSARTAIDLIARDVASAGTGIGYAADRALPADRYFPGLQFRQFSPLGNPAAVFNLNNAFFTLNLAGSLGTTLQRGNTWTFPTRDLGILVADGPYFTISRQSGNLGQYCDARNQLTLNDRIFAIMRTEDLISARSVVMRPTGNSPQACAYGECEPLPGNPAASGCRAFEIEADPLSIFASDPLVDTLSYTGGEFQTGLRQIIWWVNPDPVENFRANLRRAEVTYANRCLGATAVARANCGSEVAYNVEALHYQVWRFDPTAAPGANPDVDDNRWILLPIIPPVPPAPLQPDPPQRLRVDIELVVRARQPDGRLHPGNWVSLANQGPPNGRCIPFGTVSTGACPNGDQVERRIYRVSVEVKNSGRMRGSI
jgi:hypothetical protein